jgi:UrcA family protein
MNTRSILSGRLGAPHTASGAAILMTLFGIVPVGTIADQSAATATVSSVADVPLADLNLSTPEGMRLARDRLYTVAGRVCAERSGSRKPSLQSALGACVNGTVAKALRQIDALKQADTTVRYLVIRAVHVSLADLDLSTLEGARIARERLEAMVRRLCGEVVRRQDLSYRADFAACVQDTLAEALAQADALAADSNARTARRSAPR